MTIRGWAAGLRTSPATQYDFGAGAEDQEFDFTSRLPTTDTHRLMTSLLAPIPEPSWFPGRTGFGGVDDSGFGWGRSSSAGGSGGQPYQPQGAGAPTTNQPTPGLLETWVGQDSRDAQEHANIGKYGFNLLGTGGPNVPGGPTPYQPGVEDAAERLREMTSTENNVNNQGWWEGLFGGLFGAVPFAGEALHGAGKLIGSAIDLPFEAVGNIAPFITARLGPPSAIGGSLFGGQLSVEEIEKARAEMGFGPIDQDLLNIYQQAANENPINGLLMLSHLSKAQWQRDVEHGRRTGLMADISPATALTDQLGVVIQGLGAVFQRIPVRGLTGVLDVTQRDAGPYAGIEQIKDLIRQDHTELIKNEKWRGVAERWQRGDFGPLNSPQSREKVLDALITGGAIGFTNSAPMDAQDVGSGTPGDTISMLSHPTFQGISDFLFSAMTDVTTWSPFVFARIGNGIKASTLAANARVYRAVPQEAMRGFMEAVGETGMRLGNYDNPIDAWIAINRSQNNPELVIAGRKAAEDGGFEAGVLDEVLADPRFANEPWAPAARAELDGMRNWRVNIEPRLRPIAAMHRAISDPFQMFGVNVGDRAIGSIYDTNATEGWLKGAGSLDAHARLQDRMAAEGGNFLSEWNEGLGIASSNFSRANFRNWMVQDIHRMVRLGFRDVVPFARKPAEVIEDKISGSRGKDIATDVEMYAHRVRPRYFAQGKGGKQAALEAGREEAAKRLELAGHSTDRARAMASDMDVDEISLVDAGYFGLTTKRFTTARAKAMTRPTPKGGIDHERLTILGPRQMTVQEAEEVLRAIERGDDDAVRAARDAKELLFDNFSADLEIADLKNQIKALLTDQIKAGNLPNDLPDFTGLTREMREWAEANAPVGYRPGFRPENDDMWRVTYDDDGKIVGINPWIDFVSQVADVPAYKRWQLARSMLFGSIRSQRIMQDARIRLADIATDKYGMTRSQADSLFARFIRTAGESDLTPRAMSPNQIYKIVHSQSMADEVRKSIGVAESIRLLNEAFEGNWRHVGVSQKFTGRSKTMLGGQTNWVGLVAERLYPLARYTTSLVFQVQELIEPFILNIQRGNKPGIRPNEWDDRTLRLIEDLIRDGKYAFDDQIERGPSRLWGFGTAHNVFSDKHRIGRLVNDILSLGNIKGIKQTNLARTTRHQLGVHVFAGLERTAPDLVVTLPILYRTNDWGKIAVRFLEEKSRLPAFGETPTHVLKPSYLGYREPVLLNKVVAHFDDYESAVQLRKAVKDGDLSPDDFTDVLERDGADPDFISRAYTTALLGQDPEQFWDQWVDVFPGGQAMGDELRNTVRNAALTEGIGEEEWIAKYMADIPQMRDARALAALPPSEKRHMRLMAEIVDANAGTPRPQAVTDTLADWRNKTKYADREIFAIVDEDGTLLHEAQQRRPWEVLDDGEIKEGTAGLGPEVQQYLPEIKGKRWVHNHPSHEPMSSADIITSVEHEAIEGIVETPFLTYSLLPDPDEGWLTESFIREYGDPAGRTGSSLSTYWLLARQRMSAEWQNEGNLVAATLMRSPYYASRGDEWTAYLSQVATNTAVSRIARRYGWDFSSISHPLMATDPAIKHRQVMDFLQNAPPHLKNKFKEAYSSQVGLRVDTKAGASTALKVSQRDRAHLPELNAEQDAARMEGIEGWMRTRVAPLVGAAVTDVQRGLNGNAVWDTFATPEQQAHLSALTGYLLRMDEVVSAKVIPNLRRANPARGERWSLAFVSDADLTPAQADEMIGNISTAIPEVAQWGRPMVVRTTDGRTGIRFILRDQAQAMNDVQFQDLTADFYDRMSRMPTMDVSGEIRREVVDFSRISSDWAADGGEGYLARLRGDRPDLVTRLEHGLAQEFESELDYRTQLVAPDEYAAHRAALAAAGESVPDLPVPGDWTPTPLADRLSITLPGGRESFFDGKRTLSLWEAQGLKAQAIDAKALYGADPDLYVNLMKAIWRSKDKTLDDDTFRKVYNQFSFGALTAGSALDQSEAATALVRAKAGTGLRTGIAHIKAKAVRLIEHLPERFRRDESPIGIMFQLDEGLRISGFELDRTPWITSAQRSDWGPLIQNADERMRDALDADRDALAKTITSDLKAGGYQIDVHPFPTRTFTDASSGKDLSTYVSIQNPNARMRGKMTNQTWGRIMKWLADDIFDHESPAVQRFITPQVGESRRTFGLRMSSILPGIDVKTAMMAMQGAGPGQLSNGALDTHILRYIARSAAARGELGGQPFYQRLMKVKFRKIRNYQPFRDNITNNTRDWNLTPHEDSEFADNKVFLNETNDVGFMVTPDGDLQNVFNNSEQRGAARAGVERAIAEGAVHLDAYDGMLPEYYAQFGFREVGRKHFVDDYAPDGWDYEARGRPDVVFMALTREGDYAKSANYLDDMEWDDAKALAASTGAEARAAAPAPSGLLDRLTPSEAEYLRKQLVSGSDEFRSPRSKRVNLVPAELQDAEWGPAKENAMRRSLARIPDEQMRAMYEHGDVLKLVAEASPEGHVNLWGGNYAVLEEYFQTTLREAEVKRLRTAGHTIAADAVENMTGAEWQWFKWDQIRGVALDPHVSMSAGADLMSPRTGAELDRALQIQRSGSPYDPMESRLWHQKDGKIMGYTQLTRDNRAIVGATQHADSRTGLHELAHVFEKRLDPSLQDTVLEQFRIATGSKRTKWNRDVSEWWADEFLRYIRGGSLRGMNHNLRTSFEYFRKSVDGTEATILVKAETAKLVKARARDIARAEKVLGKNTEPLKTTTAAARKAMNRLEQTQTALRKARGKAKITDLESQAARLDDEVVARTQDLLDAKMALREATSGAKQAEVRAKDALGSKRAGGARMQANAAARRVDAARAEVERVDDLLNNPKTGARPASTAANRKLAGAKRRTPLTDYINARDSAKAEADALSQKAATLQKINDDAKAALDEARKRPTKPPKPTLTKPTISPQMQALFDSILRPPKAVDTKWGPGSPVDGSAHYDINHEAGYQSALFALSRAEENAFTLHYYKRGRSFVERSINHPYFGLYPASYMWGKVLPEMLRFLLVEPFGLNAPLGGLALARNVWAQSLQEQMYNEDFRQMVVDNEEMFNLFSLMTPALPWEIPVNTPAWLRRTAEASVIYDDKMADLRAIYGDNIPEELKPPLMDAQTLFNTAADSFSYAMGPIQSIKQAGSLIGSTEQVLTDAFSQIENVLRGGQGAAATQPVSPPATLPTGTTLPSQGQGYQP